MFIRTTIRIWPMVKVFDELEIAIVLTNVKLFGEAAHLLTVVRGQVFKIYRNTGNIIQEK